jgi:glucose/mannose transport system permease protein
MYLKNTLTFTVFFLSARSWSGFSWRFAEQKGRRGHLRNIFLFPMAISFVSRGDLALAAGARNHRDRPLGVNYLFSHWPEFLQSGWYTDPSIGIRAVVIAAAWQCLATSWPSTWPDAAIPER